MYTTPRCRRLSLHPEVACHVDACTNVCGVTWPEPPRLLDQLREAAQARFGRSEPGERYAQWSRRYIIFHGKQHPRDLGAGYVGRFLEHVAQSETTNLRFR
jgi:hypothetical protein